MTGREYRRLHGDPADWTDDEYEQFAECATPGDPTPARELLARLADKPGTPDPCQEADLLPSLTTQPATHHSA
jgi:hypothetical protein